MSYINKRMYLCQNIFQRFRSTRTHFHSIHFAVVFLCHDFGALTPIDAEGAFCVCTHDERIAVRVIRLDCDVTQTFSRGKFSVVFAILRLVKVERFR